MGSMPIINMHNKNPPARGLLARPEGFPIIWSVVLYNPSKL